MICYTQTSCGYGICKINFRVNASTVQEVRAYPRLFMQQSHSGLKKARHAVLPAVPWQKCLFRLAQNAQAYAPNREMKSEIGAVLRDIYQAPSKHESLERLKLIVEHYEKTAPKLSEWLEENYEEGLTFYEFSPEHWKKNRTNNTAERLNQEIKRRTRVARLFPNKASCLRLVTAVLAEVHEEWISGRKYMGEI